MAAGRGHENSSDTPKNSPKRLTDASYFVCYFVLIALAFSTRAFGVL